MYRKNRIPGYLVVTKSLEPPTKTYAYETWVFPLPKLVREEPTILRYTTEEAAIAGHIETMARFLEGE